MKYGYNDKEFVKKRKLRRKDWIFISLAIIFLVGSWFFLNYKLIVGEEWISETYDHIDWRTNEGNLKTNGAWDFETHVWKAMYMKNNFPNYHWNPYWYLGMPTVKYYQSAFYFVTIFIMLTTGLTAAKSALWFVMLGHLAAVILTFILSFKLSKSTWIATIVSFFLIANNFITVRSYGWEPISVAFIFLYPLGLLFFLRNPTKPLRLSLILTMAVTYLAHPLIFFALAMTFGVYLFSISITHNSIHTKAKHKHYIFKYFLMILLAILIGAVQFFPQLTYSQVTSGAHMGVKYIPMYHVPNNIISATDFFLDAGNLKGPGFAILAALFILLVFGFSNFKNWDRIKDKTKTVFGNNVVFGLAFVVLTMVVFYYFEKYNIFPMNLLRSIQYHRIIPEFIIASSVLIASMWNVVRKDWQKYFYAIVLISLFIASFVVLYESSQTWKTTDTIENKHEFIHNGFDGRITFPYSEQSLSVRNSFLETPQVYGYYEQGITNPYADELFSVSSGFHDRDLALIYFKAANVQRIYVNEEEGEANRKTKQMFSDELNFTKENERYSYAEIPLDNPSFAETISLEDARFVQSQEPKCRIFYKEEYCGSVGEEFVSVDTEEVEYLSTYNEMLAKPIESNVVFEQVNPHLYKLRVENAKTDEAIVVKMTYDENFEASIEGNEEELEIEDIGPYFMLIKPNKEGNYVVNLKYGVSRPVWLGAIVSIITLIAVIVVFGVYHFKFKKVKFNKGDM